MKSLLSLLALLAAAPVPAQVKLFVDEGSFGALLPRPALYDGMMVATALGPAVGHPLPDAPWLAAQPVRVVDSRAYAPGTVVSVFFEMVGRRREDMPKPGVPIDPRGTMPIGRTVLLLAHTSLDGKLILQGRGDFNQPEERAVALDPTAGPSVNQLAFYPTTAGRLPDDASPKWRLLKALAAAIPGTADDNAREIAGYLGGLPIEQRYSRGQGDDKLSRTFADAVRNDTAYHRALVDHALNELHYFGYADRYSRDVYAAAEDPNAFPDGLPYTEMFYEDPARNPTLPKDFKHDPPLSNADIMGVLGRAKSPALAAGFLKGLDKPSDADVQTLADKYLAFADPRARWAIAERLAFWYGAPKPDEPVETVAPDGTRSWASSPSLDASVAYWKAKLGVLGGRRLRRL